MFALPSGSNDEGATMPATKAQTSEQASMRKARKPARATKKQRSKASPEMKASRRAEVWKVSRASKKRPVIEKQDIPLIKTWLKYGLNMAQAASVYGVDEEQMRNAVGANKEPWRALQYENGGSDARRSS